jgi:hypothetical protein
MESYITKLLLQFDRDKVVKVKNSRGIRPSEVAATDHELRGLSKRFGRIKPSSTENSF